MSTDTLEVTEHLSLEEVQKVAMEAKELTRETGTSLQLIIFRLGGEEYALPIDQVKEIVLTPGMAKIPQTPEYIKGVSNIRGTIIAMMDLEEKFDLIIEKKAELTDYKYTLVIESESHRVGILVRQVPSTLSVLEAKIDRSADVMQFSSLDQECIEGIVKSDNRLIILVDILGMIESEQLTLPSLKTQA